MLSIAAENHQTQSLARMQADFFLSAGRRLSAFRWPSLLRRHHPLTDTGALKLMHRGRASNYDMLMRTQCTICLSSDHSERRPQHRRHLYHFSLPSSPLPLPPLLLAVGREGKLGWSRPPSQSTSCFLPTFFSPFVSSPLRLSEAPEASSFPPSSLSLLFFSFPVS